jgi:hypothetical protein
MRTGSVFADTSSTAYEAIKQRDELEHVVRNERAEHDQAEELRAKWAEWSDALEDDAVLARQVLGKVLAGAPMYVRPGVTPKTWFFVGLASFEAVIRGAVRPGAITTYVYDDENPAPVVDRGAAR